MPEAERPINLVIKISLLQVRQQVGWPAGLRAVLVADVGFGPEVAGGKIALLLMVDVQGQAHLLEIVLALQSPGRFPRALHGRQQQRHENADDGNHHQ